jgi:hypothetical protein
MKGLGQLMGYWRKINKIDRKMNNGTENVLMTDPLTWWHMNTTEDDSGVGVEGTEVVVIVP